MFDDIFDKYKKKKGLDVFDKYKPITSEPTQFGIGAKAVGGVTLPEPVEVPSGWGISDVTKPMDLSKLPETGKKIIQMLGGQIGLKLTEPETYKQIDDISKEINKQPDQLSKIAKAHELLTGESIEQSLKEMGEPTLQPWEKTGLTYKLGVGEIEFTILPEKFNQAQALAQQAMQFSTSGKIGDVMQTVARDAVLAYLVGYGLKTIYKSGMRVEGTWVSGKKLETAVKRAQKAYIPETGKFKSTLSDNDFRIIKAIQGIVRTTGVKAGEVAGVKVPQQVLLGQAGKITNLVKIIQNAGKMTPETVTQSKALSPSAVTQVAAQLAPALASEFLKAIEKPEVPKVQIEDDYKLIDKWIKTNIPKVSVSGHGGLKEVSSLIREGKAPKKVLEAMHRQFDKTKDQETGEILWWDDDAYPRTGTLMDFYNAYENLDLITKHPPITKKIVQDLAERAEKAGEVLPKELYRGGLQYDREKISKEGIPFTESKKIAEDYVKAKKAVTEEKEAEITKISIKPDARVLTFDNIPKDLYKTNPRNQHYVDNQQKLVDWAKKQGYDVIDMREFGLADQEIRVLNSDVIIPIFKQEAVVEAPEKIEPPPKEPWEPLTLPPPAEVPKIEPEFKEPNVHKYYMPKDQLMREIGAEPLTRPLILKKEAFMLKKPEVKKWIKNVLKEAKAKPPFAEKLKAGIFNKPTEEVARFRDLLNTYEYSPDFMEPETKAKFDQLRSFTKGMLHDTNEMRVRAGLKPIPDFGAYVPHFLDELARKIHYDEETRTKVEGIVGKKLYRGPKGGNPTARQRKIGAELDHIFSKDLEKLLMSMAMYDLRDIYLAEPYAIYRAQMDELIKEGSMPQEVRTEVENFIAYDIFDKRTSLDNAINATLKPGTNIVNLFLKPFNRVITDPVRIISSIYRFGVFGGAIAGKVRMLPRNFLQFALNLSIYGPQATIKGQFVAPKDVVEKIRNLDVYKLSIRKFEDVPAAIPWGAKTAAKLIQAGLAPYAKTHAGLTYISNVDRSARVGYFWSLGKQEWQKSKGAMEYTKAYAKKMGIKEGTQRYENLFHREGDELLEAEEAIGQTQWFYFQTRMPRPYRGQAAKAFWSLNSWWMNYFGRHWREMMSRCRGTTGRGRILTTWERWNAIKGLAIILGVGEAVRRKYKLRISEFLAFPFPKYIQTHLFQIMINTYGALTAATQKERDTYQSRVKYNLKMLVPYSGAYKEYIKFINGEITLKEYLFYVEQVSKGEISPPSDIFDKYGPTKTTEEDTFDKYGKETRGGDIFDKYKR